MQCAFRYNGEDGVHDLGSQCGRRRAGGSQYCTTHSRTPPSFLQSLFAHAEENPSEGEQDSEATNSDDEAMEVDDADVPQEEIDEQGYDLTLPSEPSESEKILADALRAAMKQPETPPGKNRSAGARGGAPLSWGEASVAPPSPPPGLTVTDVADDHQLTEDESSAAGDGPSSSASGAAAAAGSAVSSAGPMGHTPGHFTSQELQGIICLGASVVVDTVGVVAGVDRLHERCERMYETPNGNLYHTSMVRMIEEEVPADVALPAWQVFLALIGGTIATVKVAERKAAAQQQNLLHSRSMLPPNPHEDASTTAAHSYAASAPGPTYRPAPSAPAVYPPPAPSATGNQPQTALMA